MRRLLPFVVSSLVTTTLSLYVACAASYAQTGCPPQNGIESCPDAGCGSWDRQFDLKKNLHPDPQSLMPVDRSLEQIRAMEYPEQWFSGKDRAELEKLGEGSVVRVTAYLV